AGVEVPLVHGDLPAEDLLLAAGIAGDVDPLHEDLGAFVDLVGDVDPPVWGVLGGLRIHVGGGAPDGAVQRLDAGDAVPHLAAREDVAGLEGDAAADLLHRHHVVSRDVHAPHRELRPLHHHDPDGDAGLVLVHDRVRRLHPRLDVTVVV